MLSKCEDCILSKNKRSVRVKTGDYSALVMYGCVVIVILCQTYGRMIYGKFLFGGSNKD